MERTKITDVMIEEGALEHDGLRLCGDTTRDGGAGEPCVTAATDTMAESTTWVYITLERAVEHIVSNKDNLPVSELAGRIRSAVERGIESGARQRKDSGSR